MDLPGIETRMVRWMFIVAVICEVPALTLGGLEFGLAFALGAVLGIINFHWLWETGTSLMNANVSRVPVKTIAIILVRYPLTMAGLAILYLTHWIAPLPVVAGLLVPVAGVIVGSLHIVSADLRFESTSEKEKEAFT